MNTKQQDGIVNRFWRRMEEIVREELDKYNQKQQQQKLQGSAKRDRILSGSQTSQADNTIDLIPEQTNTIMDADFEDNNSLNKLTEDVEEKLTKYKAYLEKGLISKEQYDEAIKGLLGI